ncbi:hypothetical protein PVAND_016579 [Polypedilum vanderplanki]|uniref:Uncharacterized protein n=1 Tax=Polypedilum vanderplanki TaxID=319348 RepID=A0A9J6BFI9_POLVA|nr:hypothetical protein PVAND_016579 [Polypedilum vanderplanki]
MYLIEKFLFCFTIETGGRITSWYCSVVNIAYITVLMMVLNSFDVLNEKMTGFEKFQILMVATCVNFFIYYIFGAMVLTVGVLERNYSILKSFFMFHAAMTISILFGGMFFSFKYTSPQKEHHHHKPEKHTMMDEGQTHEVGHVVEEHEKEPNLELLALTTVDFLIRSYMTLCVYSL